jgi:hypothetical protein
MKENFNENIIKNLNENTYKVTNNTENNNETENNFFDNINTNSYDYQNTKIINNLINKIEKNDNNENNIDTIIDNEIEENSEKKQVKFIKFNVTPQKSMQKKNNIIDKNNTNSKLIINEYEKDITNFDIKFPLNYSLQHIKCIKKQNFSSLGKILKIYENGCKEIIYKSGSRKLVFKDGYQIIYFNNYDVKQTFPNGKIVYFYFDYKTILTTLSTGEKYYKFENGLVEKITKDGKSFIIHEGDKNYFNKNIINNNFNNNNFNENEYLKKNGIKKLITPSGTEIYEFS